MFFATEEQGQTQRKKKRGQARKNKHRERKKGKEKKGSGKKEQCEKEKRGQARKRRDKMISHEQKTNPGQLSRSVAANIGLMKKYNGTAIKEAPIQRKVTSFSATSDKKTTPVQDLINTLDYKYFVESESEVDKKILSLLKNPAQLDVHQPSKISATINSGGTTLPRKSHKSGVVGKIGMDEFALKSGGTLEVFEGGHLIPHEVWSKTDKDRAKADDYQNLVPMSRNMNVGSSDTWRDIEEKILAGVKNLKVGEELDVTIDINRSDWELAYETVARIFRVNIDPTEDGKDTVRLWQWLPESLKPNGKTKTSSLFNTSIYENPIHETTSTISTSDELIEALKFTPLWWRMDPSLKDDLENL
jgi:hypothetical protein